MLILHSVLVVDNAIDFSDFRHAHGMKTFQRFFINIVHRRSHVRQLTKDCYTFAFEEQKEEITEAEIRVLLPNIVQLYLKTEKYEKKQNQKARSQR